MKHLSLFSGIGGFDLAAEWMGWENIAQVEIDPFCLKVLKKNFPYAKRYTDIRTFPASDYAGRIDIITGGFPCQPFSHAGKRRGSSDDRHLWPEMLRVIRTIKPPWIVAENVRGLLTIEQGMVFEQVCVDLEKEGYEVQPFIIPACAVNAPHKRERIWFIANYQCKRSIQCQSEEWTRPKEGIFEGNNSMEQWGRNWHEIAAELCSVDDGLPVELGEFKLTRAGHRNAQIKAYGNAIVPQVAYQIFKSLNP